MKKKCINLYEKKKERVHTKKNNKNFTKMFYIQLYNIIIEITFQNKKIYIVFINKSFNNEYASSLNQMILSISIFFFTNYFLKKNDTSTPCLSNFRRYQRHLILKSKLKNTIF